VRSSVSVYASPMASAGKPGQRQEARARRVMLPALLSASLALSGCSSVGNLFGGGGSGTDAGPVVKGFLGGVVADEPRAVLAARDVLAAGGNAADAAVAAGFMLSVTLPSRAGLGASGVCLAYNPDKNGPGNGAPEAILFSAAPGGGGGDRPAAVPTLARGLYALQARYGKRPFETLITPAEQTARFGVPVSRAFARDLAVVAGPLAGNAEARAIFYGPSGQVLGEGDKLIQPELAATLAQLRVSGVGDLYQGALARRLVQASADAGGGITLQALSGAIPGMAAPLTMALPGGDVVSLPPGPVDGGAATLAALKALINSPNDFDGAQQAALAVRGGAPRVLPASTSFLTLDREGNAVACAVSMNNLFGTGRIAAGTGMVLAASPAAVPAPLLSLAMATNPNLRAFRAEVGGSGQEGAPVAAASALVQALTDRSRPAMPMSQPVPEPGRANAIACTGYLPDATNSCGWAVDSRSAGLAIGSN